MRFLLFVPCLLFLCGCATDNGSAGATNNPDDAVTVEANVVRLEIEGGFWGLIAEDGKKYAPRQLPERFQQEGLQVRAEPRVLRDVMTTQMWGETVEIVAIEKR